MNDLRDIECAVIIQRPIQKDLGLRKGVVETEEIHQIVQTIAKAAYTSPHKCLTHPPCLNLINFGPHDLHELFRKAFLPLSLEIMTTFVLLGQPMRGTVTNGTLAAREVGECELLATAPAPI